MKKVCFAAAIAFLFLGGSASAWDVCDGYGVCKTGKEVSEIMRKESEVTGEQNRLDAQHDAIVDRPNVGGNQNPPSLALIPELLIVWILCYILIYGIVFGIPIWLVYRFIVRPIFRALVRDTAHEWEKGRKIS
jgi:hypothetical protein